MRPVDPRLFRRAGAARRYLVLLVAVGAADAALMIAQADALAAVVADGFLKGLTLGAAAPRLGVVAAAAVGRSVLTWTGESAAAATAAAVKSRLRRDLLEHELAAGGRRTAADARDGENALLATRGVDALDGYFARYLPQVVLAVLVPAAVAARVLAADPVSGTVVAATVPLVPLFMVLIGKASRAAMDRRWRTLEALSGHFLELLAGLPTLKAFGRSRAQAGVVRRAADRQRRATVETLRWGFLSGLALELIATLSVALVAVTVGVRLVGGGLPLRAGLLALILAPEAYLPLRRLGARYHDAAEGLAAADRILARLADREPERSDIPRAAAAPPASGRAPHIVLDQVTVRRAGRASPVLDAFTLDIAPGRITGLVGASGAGKSTVLALVLGFVQPCGGRLTVDGADVDGLDLAAWRSRIAWVPQRPYLAPGSVADNIRLGRGHASDAEVRAAAVSARLDVGLDRAVGVRGTALSGGEARRVALARALLRDAPVVLLDEPTEGLDAATELDLLDVLRTALAGRTCLVVAHSPAVAGVCDTVVRLGAPAAEPAGASAAVPASAQVSAPAGIRPLTGASA